jgi:hypothetical protein
MRSAMPRTATPALMAAIHTVKASPFGGDVGCNSKRLSRRKTVKLGPLSEKHHCLTMHKARLTGPLWISTFRSQAVRSLSLHLIIWNSLAVWRVRRVFSDRLTGPAVHMLFQQFGGSRIDARAPLLFRPSIRREIHPRSRGCRIPHRQGRSRRRKPNSGGNDQRRHAGRRALRNGRRGPRPRQTRALQNKDDLRGRATGGLALFLCGLGGGPRLRRVVPGVSLRLPFRPRSRFGFVQLWRHAEHASHNPLGFL